MQQPGQADRQTKSRQILPSLWRPDKLRHQERIAANDRSMPACLYGRDQPGSVVRILEFLTFPVGVFLSVYKPRRERIQLTFIVMFSKVTSPFAGPALVRRLSSNCHSSAKLADFV
jgi:hypothetical protein